MGPKGMSLTGISPKVMVLMVPTGLMRHSLISLNRTVMPRHPRRSGRIRMPPMPRIRAE